MTAASILTECRARQVRLAVDGGVLTFEGPPGAMDGALLGQIREHKAELMAHLKAANDPGPAPRWRIVHPDGRTFEVSCYPQATRGEVLAREPEGTQAEPITPPTGGTLPQDDRAVIEAVCSAWGATPDEVRDAMAEASANPALMAGWRGVALGPPETMLHRG